LTPARRPPRLTGASRRPSQNRTEDLADRSTALVHRPDRPRPDHDLRPRPARPVSADLLRGTLETLQREGHRAITLDAGDLSGPAHEADAVLTGMVRELSTLSAQVVVRRKSAWHPRGPRDAWTGLFEDTAP
jgi:hypothetical protein